MSPSTTPAMSRSLVTATDTSAVDTMAVEAMVTERKRPRSMAAETMGVETIAAEPTSWAGMRPASATGAAVTSSGNGRTYSSTDTSLDPLGFLWNSVFGFVPGYARLC